MSGFGTNLDIFWTLLPAVSRFLAKKKEAQNDLKILIILYKLAAGGKKSGFTVGIKPIVRGISLRKLLPIGTYFKQIF